MTSRMSVLNEVGGLHYTYMPTQYFVHVLFSMFVLHQQLQEYPDIRSCNVCYIPIAVILIGFVSASVYGLFKHERDVAPW